MPKKSDPCKDPNYDDKDTSTVASEKDVSFGTSNRCRIRVFFSGEEIQEYEEEDLDNLEDRLLS